MDKEFSREDVLQFIRNILDQRHDEVRAALEGGMSPETRDDCRVPVLVLAARHGDAKMLALLVEFGAKVNSRVTGLPSQERDAETALNLAGLWGEIEAIEWLLAHGAEPRMLDSSRRTAAHILIDCLTETAAQPDGVARIETALSKMLDLGVPVNQQDEDGRTLLHAAAAAKHLPASTTHLLLSRGADARITDFDGLTALHRAADGGHLEALRAMIQAGVSIDMTNTFGETILHRCRDPELADVIFDAGANVDAQDHNGRTPLALCIRGTRSEQVEFTGPTPMMLRLLNAGAGLDVPDLEGVTPRQLVGLLKMERLSIAVAALEARQIMRRTAISTVRADQRTH